MDLIATLTLRQVEQGAEVSVIFASRPDTPLASLLADIFDARVNLVGTSAPLDGRAKSLIWLRSAVRRELSVGDYSAVHLHSTFAGLLGRIGFGRRSYRNKTFYSPHGFSFLRQDLSKLARRVMVEMERLAARRGFVVLTTKSELELARLSLPRAKLRLLVNGIRVSALPHASVPIRDRPQVAMVGRVTYQKAPWVFARIADQLSDLADFVWYGDGAASDKSNWLASPNVEVTGWMPLAQLRERLKQSDLILFPTLWEGMPLSLIEAQSIGVPAVATRIVGNRDIVVDGTTGYLCDTEEDLLARTRELLLDADLRLQMSKNAQIIVRPRFDDRRLGEDSLALYRGAIEGSSTS